MTTSQWRNPTPEQIAQAEEMAARIGEKPYWMGETLFVGQPAPEQPLPDPMEARRAALIEAGFSEGQADALLTALGVDA